MPMRILRAGREDASDSAIKMAMESLARLKMAQPMGQDMGTWELEMQKAGNPIQPTPKSTAVPSEIKPAAQTAPAPVTPGQTPTSSTTSDQVESFIAANPEAARAIFAKHPELAGKVTPQHPM